MTTEGYIYFASNKTVPRPIERKHVTMNCPVDGCESNCVINWSCFKCNNKIEYGLEDGLFHCPCGSNEAIDVLLACLHHSPTKPTTELLHVNIEGFIGTNNEDSIPHECANSPEEVENLTMSCQVEGCQSDTVTVYCSKCRKAIEFVGEDELFHCHCGSSSTVDVLFSCTNHLQEEQTTESIQVSFA